MMAADLFKREKEYQATMFLALSMLEKGVIDQRDYDQMKELMLRKYRPLLGSLIG